MAPNVLTQWIIFGLYVKLIGHLPVYSWLCVATMFVKQRASAVTTGWDNEVQDPFLCQMLAKIIARASQMDPSRGYWYVNEQDITMW